MVEHWFCKPAVVGSSPTASSVERLIELLLRKLLRVWLLFASTWVSKVKKEREFGWVGGRAANGIRL